VQALVPLIRCTLRPPGCPASPASPGCLNARIAPERALPYPRTGIAGTPKRENSGLPSTIAGEGAGSSALDAACRHKRRPPRAPYLPAPLTRAVPDSRWVELENPDRRTPSPSVCCSESKLLLSAVHVPAPIHFGWTRLPRRRHRSAPEWRAQFSHKNILVIWASHGALIHTWAVAFEPLFVNHPMPMSKICSSNWPWRSSP
jgi:hypothetical protein